MGRPRKRPAVQVESVPKSQKQQQQQQQEKEEGADSVAAPAQDSNNGNALNTLGHSIIVPSAQDTFLDSMDLDLAFLEMDGDGANFLDLLAPDYSSFDINPSAQSAPTGVKQFTGDIDSEAFWQMHSDQLLDGINFDLDGAASQTTPFEETGSERPTHSASSEPTEFTPDLSPEADPGISEQESPPDAEPVICGCLSKLYLALDSLQRLPKEVGEAIRAARIAAKTAHDTILCPVCANPPLELFSNPPIQSMQNMLVLGALLPSISNAYKQILQMVDDEAAAAGREGRKIRFTLHAYGGLWGEAAEQDLKTCATQAIANVILEPNMWRVAARALLRLDVYGLNPDKVNGESAPGVCAAMSQPGLKDLILMMEERTRQRHEQIDAMVADGTLIVGDNCEHVPLASGQKPTCMRIVDIAKQSMRELVIP